MASTLADNSLYVVGLLSFSTFSKIQICNRNKLQDEHQFRKEENLSI